MIEPSYYYSYSIFEYCIESKASCPKLPRPTVINYSRQSLNKSTCLVIRLQRTRGMRRRLINGQPITVDTAIKAQMEIK